MKKGLPALIGVIGMLSTTPASAAETYIAPHFTYHNISVGSSDLNPYSIGAAFGGRITPHFAAELRLSGGVGADDSFGTDISVKHAYGVYALIGTPLAERGSLHAIVGYTRMEVDVGGFGSDDDGDVSYGVGGAFNMSDRTAFTIEWLRQFDKDGVTIDGVSLGVLIRMSQR